MPIKQASVIKCISSQKTQQTPPHPCLLTVLNLNATVVSQDVLHDFSFLLNSQNAVYPAYSTFSLTAFILSNTLKSLTTFAFFTAFDAADERLPRSRRVNGASDVLVALDHYIHGSLLNTRVCLDRVGVKVKRFLVHNPFMSLADFNQGVDYLPIPVLQAPEFRYSLVLLNFCDFSLVTSIFLPVHIVDEAGCCDVAEIVSRIGGEAEIYPEFARPDMYISSSRSISALHNIFDSTHYFYPSLNLVRNITLLQQAFILLGSDKKQMLGWAWPFICPPSFTHVERGLIFLTMIWERPTPVAVLLPVHQHVSSFESSLSLCVLNKCSAEIIS